MRTLTYNIPGVPPFDLKKVEDLQYDAYRSLVWIVRSKQVYINNQVPFSEFKWSDFFRKRILILEDILAGKNSINESELLLSEEGHLALTAESEEVVEEAMNLVRSSEASRLSGYIGQR